MRNLVYTTGDVETAISIMKEAAEWLIATGRKLWSHEKLTREKLMYNRQQDDFYVAYVDGEPAGAMILDWKDPEIWGDDSGTESGYIHKLSVRRTFAGKGLPSRLIGHATAVCLSKEISLLRLDCDATRPFLLELYPKLGFIEHRRIQWNDWKLALFERNLTT